MHIVFIVGSYYPNYSAVGKCVGNVADVLSKENKVTVICEKSALNQKDEEIYNNQTILRAITSDKNRRLKLMEQTHKAQGMKKNMFNILLNILKFQQALKFLFSRTSIKKELVTTYEETLIGIKENIDVIIPASMPFESVIAAHNYKGKVTSEVLLLPYLFDQFVDNESLHRLKLNKKLKKRIHQRIEKRIIVNSNKILILKQLKNYFKVVYPEFSHKLVEVEHPLIVKNNDYSNMLESQKERGIVFSYAGSFYKNIRNPEYMLKVFDKLLNEIEGVLNLYTFGNCESTIEQYSSKNESIKANGSIPSDLVENVLYDANFLVAVGNSVSNQIPSKVFEYLSYGKPIIYFFDDKDDLNIETLKKYPYSICINQNDLTTEASVAKLKSFCEINKNKILRFEQISELYFDALPEYTAQIITRSILNNN